MTNRAFSAPPLVMLLTGILMLAGAAARLYDPGRMVVWHDEVFTVMRVLGYGHAETAAAVFDGRDRRPSDLLASQRPSPERGWGDTLAALRQRPEHAPLYFLAACLAVPLGDPPIVAMRFASGLLAILLLPAIFWLAGELFDDPKASWIAAALAACSPLQVLYAQEARQYALWTVFSVAASAALLRALRRGRGWDWTLYGLLAVLGLYTHLLFAAVLGVHAVYLMIALWAERGQARDRLQGWATAVSAAGLLFAPWLGVFLAGASGVRSVTSWMSRPISVDRLLEAWGLHLVRVFADIPAAGDWLLVGLAPLVWVAWRFCTRAPVRARVLICPLFVAFLALLLVPDLLKGGLRSLHPRYALPGLTVLSLAVAWVVAAGWDAPSRAARTAVRGGLLAVLGVGVWSDLLILRSDTWWNKYFSETNHVVADRVNATERPILLVSETEVGLGEAISLAYRLDDRVVVRGVPEGDPPGSLTGFTDVFLATASERVIAALAPSYDLVPVAGTWQWSRAVPKAAPVSGVRGASVLIRGTPAENTDQRQAAEVRGRS